MWTPAEILKFVYLFISMLFSATINVIHQSSVNTLEISLKSLIAQLAFIGSPPMKHPSAMIGFQLDYTKC